MTETARPQGATAAGTPSDPGTRGTVALEDAAEAATERKRAVMLLSAERRALELVAEGKPLAAALDELVRTIQDLCPGMRASVLLLDEDGVHLRHGASPDLPADYCRAVDGTAIGPEAGSCGTAAYLNEAVIARDIATDPRWAPWRELALHHGLRACWSTPIRTAAAQVIGTFALYYGEPREPDAEQLGLIDAAAHVARIAIERHRLDAERGAMIEDLQRAVRFTEMFVGVLSHDLRNPLSGIITGAQLLARTPDPQLAEKIVPRILGSAMRMNRMIATLLDFTRIRLGQGLPIEAHPVDLAEISRRVADEMAGTSGVRRVHLECAGDTRGSWDGDRLLQLVSNLVGNALQYGAGDSPVTVWLDGTRPDSTTLKVTNAGEVAPERLRTLFDPFRREAPATPKRGGGLGLGLFISREVAEAHGGTIEVSSSDGRTCFTVELPRRDACSRATSLTFGADSRPAQPRSVVIIEDDADVRELLTDLFRGEGYVVSSEGSGKAAVERIRRAARPCVVVLDMTLPDEHGSAVYRAMQADPDLAAIPVVVSTGDPATAPSGLLMMKKPVDAKLLLETVASLF